MAAPTGSTFIFTARCDAPAPRETLVVADGLRRFTRRGRTHPLLEETSNPHPPELHMPIPLIPYQMEGTAEGFVADDGTPTELGDVTLTPRVYAVYSIHDTGDTQIGSFHEFFSDYAPTPPSPFQRGCANWRYEGTLPEHFSLKPHGAVMNKIASYRGTNHKYADNGFSRGPGYPSPYVGSQRWWVIKQDDAPIGKLIMRDDTGQYSLSYGVLPGALGTSTGRLFRAVYDFEETSDHTWNSEFHLAECARVP
jgi:hypothetical protein